MHSQAHPPEGTNQDSEIEVTGLGPRLSPRARARRLFTSLVAVLLALIVVLGSIPALRQGALALLTGPTPTPTVLSFPEPAASNFYFLSTPPWVRVLVDGHPLDHVPVADEHPQPLHLTRGRHAVEWSGTPFQPQRCTLQVPIAFIYTPRDGACLIQSYLGRPAGFVLQQRESLATLPPDHQAALLAAMEAGLGAASASATIEPGEHYLGVQAGSNLIVTTGTPLDATLRFRATTAYAWSEPCAFASGIQPCRFPAQDCRQLCTTTLPTSTAPSSAEASAWIIAVPAQAFWQLTDTSGAPVGHLAPGVSANYVLTLLRITWDGMNWRVTPLFGHAVGGAVADDTVCAPARDWLAVPTGPSTGAMVPSGPALEGLTGGVVYASGTDLTDGCFVSVPPSAFAVIPNSPITQPATFLLRFGVLLAVNAVAHQIAPQLPVADAQEQAIAQRLQGQVSGGA